MKYNITRQILNYILIIAVLFLSIGAFMFAIRAIPYSYVESGLNMYYNDTWTLNIITGATAFFFFIIAIRLLFSRKTPRRAMGALVKHTDLGEIKVSLGTLTNLTQRAVTKFDEIKDVDSRIHFDDDGVLIGLRLMVMPDVIIPEVTQRIQDEVKLYIEQISGIHVKEVQIFIQNLAHSQSSRVE
ncbi:MAG: alkaline shock response membrane anchor protein AmaP [Clostridiales bacterium]|nr:alkaline shock response membrane anchor protein AmaP [Clostridiales bacterium]